MKYEEYRENFFNYISGEEIYTEGVRALFRKLKNTIKHNTKVRIRREMAAENHQKYSRAMKEIQKLWLGHISKTKPFKGTEYDGRDVGWYVTLQRYGSGFAIIRLRGSFYNNENKNYLSTFYQDKRDNALLLKIIAEVEKLYNSLPEPCQFCTVQFRYEADRPYRYDMYLWYDRDFGNNPPKGSFSKKGIVKKES